LIQYIYDGNNLHPDILLPAMNKAFEMMKTESYPRFLRAILSGQYKSKVSEQLMTNNNSSSTRNLFHENVEIVFPNMKENELKEAQKRQSKEVSDCDANTAANLKEKELNTQKLDVIKKTAEMNDTSGAKGESTGCCCLIK